MQTCQKSLAILFASTAAWVTPVTAQDTVDIGTITLNGQGDGAVIDGYRAVTASSATKTETPLKETPQSVAVITPDMLRDQGVRTIGEALRNVSGAQGSMALQTPAFESTLLRGFPAEVFRDGMTNYLNTGDPNAMAGIERIEVLKGPNAILYGGGIGTPLGGVVNIVTKKPQERDFSVIGLSVGSNGFVEPSFDINRRLSNDGNALFRMNGSYVRSNSEIDVIKTDRYSLSPSFTFGHGTDTRLTVEGYLSKWEQQEYQGLPAWGTVAGDFLIPRDLYIGDPDIPDSMTRTRKLTMTLEHDFNDTWSSKTQLRYGKNDISQITQIIFGNAPDAGPTSWGLYNSYVPGKQTEYSLSQSIEGNFAAGGWDHTVLFGADYARIKDYSLMYMDYAGSQDLLNPGHWPVWTMPSTLAMGEGTGLYKTTGAFAQIQSSRGPLHILGGLRFASIKTVYTSDGYGRKDKLSDTKVLPRFGFVYDITDSVSVFSSWSQGMKANAFTFYAAPPKPEHSQQAEIGVKFDNGDGLSGSVAAFHIERKNVPVIDPNDPMMLTNLTEGQQRSRGFEADVVWQPNSSWSMIANYAWTHAELTADIPAGGAPAGSSLAGVPRHAGRLWVNYANGSGWRFGGGINAVSSSYIDAMNVYKTGGYATIDASASYTRDSLAIGLYVKNIADREYNTPFYKYLDGRVAPGDGRQIILSVTKSF